MTLTWMGRDLNLLELTTSLKDHSKSNDITSSWSTGDLEVHCKVEFADCLYEWFKNRIPYPYTTSFSFWVRGNTQLFKFQNARLTSISIQKWLDTGEANMNFICEKCLVSADAFSEPPLGFFN